MKTKIISVTAFFIILAFGLFSAACVGESAQGSSANTQASTDSLNCAVSPCSAENTVDAGNSVTKHICQNPLIVGVAYDQSGSMRWSGTSTLTTQDLLPLIEQVANCGGEIGVMFVRADSSKPVERLRAAEPPPPPLEPVQKTDEEDYEFADRLDEYQVNLQTHNEKIQRNKKELQPAVDKYLSELSPLLAQKPKGNTDFWSGINRLDVFLAESDAPWHTKPHRYLVIISDGEDTIGSKKRPFKSNAAVIWVNANASEKTLKGFLYQRFESFPAAIREILAKEGGK